MKFAKKSLGQNFLIGKNIINKIVGLVKIQDKDVIEIGPGKGALTSEILKKKPKSLSLIEKDNFLFKISVEFTIFCKIFLSIKKFCPKLFLGFSGISIQKTKSLN